jgi:hypothetical protein
MDQLSRIARALTTTAVVSGLWSLVILLWLMVLESTASSNVLLA